MRTIKKHWGMGFWTLALALRDRSAVAGTKKEEKTMRRKDLNVTVLAFALALSLGLMIGCGGGDGGGGGGGGSWQQLSPSGSLPPTRYGPQVIYDPTYKRMLVYGGQDGGCYNDTWSLSLAAPGSEIWTKLTPGGSTPPGTTQRGTIFDPLNNRMLVHGAVACGGTSSDTWSVSISGANSVSYSLLSASGLAPARHGQVAIFDQPHNRMIIWGGRDSGGTSVPNTTFAMSLNAGSETWTQLNPSGSLPHGRNGVTGIYDPVNKRMIIFGGYDWTPKYYNDVWALDLTNAGSESWMQLSPSGTPPSPRDGAASIYDPVGRRMIIFGGSGSSTTQYNEVWNLNLTSGSESWNLLSPTGSQPSVRSSAGMVYDSQNHRAIIFSGWNSTAGKMNDVWALDL